MTNILIAAFSIAALVALAFVCVRFREPGLKMLGNMPLWSSPASATAEKTEPKQTSGAEPRDVLERPKVTKPAPRPKSSVAHDPVMDLTERERFSSRRVETAAKVLIAEVEEYLARKADSR